MTIPNEFSLLSLFECEPNLLDDNIPYFYNEATYEFTNSAKERFIVIISPSYSDIKIQVLDYDTIETISLLDFKNVDKVEIISDKKEQSKIGIKIEYGFIEVSFKPRFKVLLNLKG